MAVSGVVVLDAHALYRYWAHPSRLGDGARAAFDAIEQRTTVGLVPSIAVAEILFLSARHGCPRSAAELLHLIDRAEGLRVVSLTRQHLTVLDRLGDVPEMHDSLRSRSGSAPRRADCHSGCLDTRLPVRALHLVKGQPGGGERTATPSQRNRSTIALSATRSRTSRARPRRCRPTETNGLASRAAIRPLGGNWPSDRSPIGPDEWARMRLRQ